MDSKLLYVRYKEYSNIELVKIIESPDAYQHIAVDVAMRIIKERQISEEQYINLRRKFEQEKRDAQERMDLPKKAKFTFSNLLNFSNLKPVSRIIRIYVLFFSVLLIIRFVGEYKHLINLLRVPTNWNLSTLNWFIPYIYIIPMLLLLWKEKLAGWMMMIFLMSYTALNSFLLFLSEIHILNPEKYEVRGGLLIVMWIISFLAFSAIIAHFNTKKIRGHFNITSLINIICISAGLISNVFIWLFYIL